MNDLQIQSDIIKQFKDLNAKEEKLFYYSYGKMEHINRSIVKTGVADTAEEASDKHNFTATIPYSEIKLLENVKRVDRATFMKIKNQLLNNSFISYEEDGVYKTFMLYKHIFFDNNKRKVEIEFNGEIASLLDNIFDGSFVNIKVKDLELINGTKELKLYLYCLSIWRKKQNSGIIKINIKNLKAILGGGLSQDNRRFYYNFVSEPTNKLKNIKGLSKNISCMREGELITLSVSGASNALIK